MVHRVVGAIAARSEADFQRINRDGTARLAEAAWEAGGTEALVRETGWRAAVEVGRGLEETARWYRAAGWL